MGNFKVLLTVIALVGLILASCEKEDNVVVKTDSTQTVMYNECDGGGDVEEDIIIRHSVVNVSNNPVAGATVDYWKTHGSTPYTSQMSDINGKSTFMDDSTGCRFIITSATGYHSDTTEVFFLQKDTSITQTLQPL